jgi:glycosyltransferase involved in cell wall biosynthesis
MPGLALVLPGDPATLTGGYEYDRRIAFGLRDLGWAVTVHALDASFPFPTPRALEHARATLAGIPRDHIVLVDGLALGAMPALAEEAARGLRLIALVHHPLALETGLDPHTAEMLRQSEARALAAAAHVVVTSPATARALAGYGVAPERVSVVVPGTDSAPLARGSGGPGLALLCVATVTRRKGHAVLIEALAGLRDRPWTLTCAGSRTTDPATDAALVRQIERLGLDDRVALAGECGREALAPLYDRADAFVLATFHEGYGMALAEALARGLPIVATRAGAVPDTVPPEAGLLVEPGDPEALRRALAQLLDDPAVHGRLARGARAARARLPDWPQACRRLAAVLSRHERLRG